NEKSDEGAPREVVHNGADDRVGGYSLEQRRAAGDDDQADNEHGGDDGDDLLDALLAGADPGDMLSDARPAFGAYAAALDDDVGLALGAFDFRLERHRGVRIPIAVERYEVRPRFASWSGRMPREIVRVIAAGLSASRAGAQP